MRADAAARPSSRPAGGFALVLALALTAATALLALRFLTDDAGTALVFLHAAQSQPWPLRLAGLWASDQGTLLLLATVLAWSGALWSRHDGWAGPGATLLALCLAGATLAWSPFEATPPELLAGPAPRHNPHLANPWMAVHPPLALAALALALAPAGAAAEALLRPDTAGRWTGLSVPAARLAWIILAAGLASGMWWAFQDASFGGFWHWDPVQAAVFALWMTLTAQLHAKPAPGPDGTIRHAALHPLLGLATAVLALLTMTVVRLPQLASSHRYVGDTSAPLLAGLTLALAAIAALAWNRRPAGPPSPRRRDALDLAIALMLASAAVALLHLGHALFAEMLHLPRPDRLKPFLDMLLRFATPTEAAELGRAFARWEPDQTALNAWLLPPVTALALAGGHLLLPAGRRLATPAAAAAVALAVLLDPVTPAFDGDGVTAAGTVDQLGRVGGLWAALAYLGLATLARLAAALRGGDRRGALVAVLHLGLAVAVASLLAATLFDRLAQVSLRWPEQAGRPIALPDGHSVTVSPAGGDSSAIRVTWRSGDGEGAELGEGEARILDHAPPPAGLRGSQRLVCESLDHRYARLVSGGRRALDPFIHRGIWRDVQVWIPALDDTLPAGLPVVARTFPLASWMWGGIALVLLAAVALMMKRTPR